jgi:hypothetical protein
MSENFQKNEENPMKKALMAVAGVALVACLSSAAFADDDAAYSANAVGVVKYVVPSNGGMACITLPLLPLETSSSNKENWVWGETSLAEQLDDNSTVYFWKNTGWQPSVKYPKGRGWSSGGGTYEIKPGEAIFVKTPVGSSSDKVLSLLGELPTDDSLEYQLSGSDNFDARGASPYPVDLTFGSSALASNLVDNSTVYFWEDGGWQPSVKYPKGRGWSSGGAEHPVTPGQGMFVRSKKVNGEDGDTITFVRPFEWQN